MNRLPRKHRPIAIVLGFVVVIALVFWLADIHPMHALIKVVHGR